MLFWRERLVITKHVSNVLWEGQQAEESNVQNLHILPPMGRLLRIHKCCNRPGARGQEDWHESLNVGRSGS